MSDQPAPSTAPVVLRLSGVTKRFPGTLALDDVRLEARAGEIHALMGGNGSGKSTLMKILSGVYAADAGTMEIRGATHDLRHFTPPQAQRCGVHIVHQHRTTFDALTVAENLSVGRGFETGFLGRIRWREARRRAEELIERFGIQARPDDVVGELRPAAQTMVEIARALQDQEGAHDGVLALDEPTAALPPHEVEVLLDALRRYAAAGQSVLFVSHRLDEVLEISDHVTVLRDGRLVGTRPAAGLTREQLVELMIGRPVEAVAPDVPVASDDRAPLLQLRGLTGGAVRGVDLAVRPGEIVGVAGLAGSGRSTLLRLAFGAQRREAGEVVVAGEPLRGASPARAMQAGLAFVPEDRAHDAMFPDLSVADNFTLANTPAFTRLGRVSRKAERRATADAVSRYHVKAASQRVEVSSLSGGNQQKISIGRWLAREPRVLLLDEPTQGVDVGARVELWDLVAQAAAGGAAVLLVSSDLEELIHLSQRIVVMRSGSVAAELDTSTIAPERVNQMLHDLEVAA